MRSAATRDCRKWQLIEDLVQKRKDGYKSWGALKSVLNDKGLRIIIIIILLKQNYKVQLANNKIQMAWLTSLLVVG